VARRDPAARTQADPDDRPEPPGPGAGPVEGFAYAAAVSAWAARREATALAAGELPHWVTTGRWRPGPEGTERDGDPRALLEPDPIEYEHPDLGPDLVVEADDYLPAPEPEPVELEPEPLSPAVDGARPRGLIPAAQADIWTRRTDKPTQPGRGWATWG
jgi:hypothetical protein